MDRNKVIGYTKTAELAREAGLFSTESPVLMPKLERFAALIEREVRGGVTETTESRWVAQTEAGKYAVGEGDVEIATCEHRDDAMLLKRISLVRQLVDALRMVMDDSDALDGRPRTYECVQEALAAAKDAGL